MAVQTLALAAGFLDVSTTRYVPLFGTSDVTTEALVQCPIPSAGKLKHLRIASLAAPGSGKSFTVTMRLGGASQSLTATISDAALYAEDLTHEVSCSLGDLVNWMTVPSGSPPDETRVMISAVYEAVGNSYLIWMGGGTGNQFVGTGTFSNVSYGMGFAAYDSSADNSEQARIPIAGTIRQFATSVEVATDNSAACTMRIFKEGTVDASADILVTNGTGTFNQNITGLSIAWSANDRFHVGAVVTGTSMTGRFRFGVAFEPSDLTQGIFSALPSALSTSVASWLNTGQSSGTAEALWGMPALTIGDFGADVGAAPGVGKTWDFDSRVGASIAAAANGNVHMDIDDAATSDTDTGDDIVTAGSFWGLRTTPTGTPTTPTNATRVFGIITWPVVTVTKDVTSAAAIAHTLTSDVSSAAAISRTLVSDVTSAAALNAPASSSVSSAAAIEAVVTKDVTSAAAISRTVSADVTSTAAIAKTITSDVTSSAAISATVSASVTSAAALSAVVVANVTTTAAVSRVEVANVTSAASVSTSNDATADVTSAAAVSAVVQASVGTSAAISTTASSDVTTGAALARTLTSDVTSSAAIQVTVSASVTSAGAISTTISASVTSAAALSTTATSDVATSAALAMTVASSVATAAALAREELADVSSVAAVSIAALLSVTTAAAVATAATRDVASVASISLIVLSVIVEIVGLDIGVARVRGLDTSTARTEGIDAPTRRVRGRDV